MRTNKQIAVMGLLVSLTACAGSPPRPYDAPPPYTIVGYAGRTPTEIAILPPAAVPNFPAAEGRALVEHVYSALVDKGYTPLSPDHTEGRLAELLPPGRPRASRPAPLPALAGALPADAYLEIDVLSVKMVPGVEPAVYRLDTQATLVGRDGGETLFQQRLPVTYEVSYEADRTLPAATRDEVLRRHVARLLAGLPARRS